MRWIACVIALGIGFVIGALRLPWELKTEWKSRRH